MRLKCQFEILNYGGECVAVPVGKTAGDFRCTVRLNETAEFILRALVDGKTEWEITNAILERYEVSEEIAASCVKEFTEKLCKEGFAEV